MSVGVIDVGTASARTEPPAEALAAAALALARRFHAGATQWCAAPAWPEHASHVAVEFVHPVVMGKPALPAVMVGDPDLVAALRSVVSSGDIVLAVAAADDTAVAESMVRSRAWGATTVWIGCGRRPETGAADHVIWADDPAGTATHDGRMVMLYHLLWELTHVCLEHPGLLAEPDELCEEDHCTTCSDEGRLVEVMDVGDGSQATVRTATGAEVVDTTLVAGVGPHDLLLVHAGMALDTVDPSPAGAPA